MRIGIVTCRTLPEPDPDQQPLLDALLEAGMQPALLPWDDGGDAGAFDVCVLRSCWNYHLHVDDFAAWIDRADSVTCLLNPAPALRWNMHKRYLRELEGDGIEVVPTAWIERGTTVELARLLDQRGWDDVVIKPAVSAASFGTRRFRRDEVAAGDAFLAALAAARDVMVQRYMTSIEATGERSLVWIDGLWSHAVRKSPRFAGGDEIVSEALPITDAERSLAERVLAGRAGGLLYARLDVMPDERGRPLVSELELLEPSLFLAQRPAALERLVAAIGRRARAAISA